MVKMSVHIVVLLLSVLYAGANSDSSLLNHMKLRPAVIAAAAGQSYLYYLGVGSNLSKSKLINRGLNGTKINIDSFEPALVLDHRVAFNLRGFPPIEPAMAGIEPCPGTQCHGSLAKVTLEEYEKIWLSEGGGRPNPAYEEVVVEAYPYGSSESVKAIALRAAPHARLQKDGAPSPRYMKLIIEGAKELGLQDGYVEKLEKVPTASVSRLLIIMSRYHIIFMSLMFRLKIQAVYRVVSKLLWVVWAPPTANRVLRLLSEAAMAVILLPGTIAGAIVKLYHDVRGIPLPSMFGTPAPAKPASTASSATETKV